MLRPEKDLPGYMTSSLKTLSCMRGVPFLPAAAATHALIEACGYDKSDDMEEVNKYLSVFFREGADAPLPNEVSFRRLREVLSDDLGTEVSMEEMEKVWTFGGVVGLATELHRKAGAAENAEHSAFV
jgi:hypothetical protein